MSEINLKVTGMTCGHCVSSVTKALQAIAGVEQAEVTLKPGAAKVQGTAKLEDLVAAIEAEGYKAEV